MKHPKAQSAGLTTSSKTQPTATTTATAVNSHDNEVKVENMSPDTSPAHRANNKPTDTILDRTFTKTKQQANDSTVQTVQDIQNTRRVIKDKTTHKPKKDTEETPAAKALAKTLPVQKDKSKELTGYAARYSQKRAVEYNSKMVEKETINALGMFDVDRPLLSPATRESMAKKRRRSDKPFTDESLASTLDNNVTSISAPVRRTKHSTLASGKVVKK